MNYSIIQKLSGMSALFAIITLIGCSGGGSSAGKISLFPVKSGNEFQYIDAEGKIVINPQFSDASVFYEGLALVRSTGENAKFGYITEDGKYAISPAYKSATIFSEDKAWVVNDNSAPQAINKKGEMLFTLQQAEYVQNFKGGLAAFCIRDSSGLKWGFVDGTGTIKINPQFQETGHFSEKMCAVANKEGKWGYINEQGVIQINYQFDYAEDFKNGLAAVKASDKMGVINTTGQYKINPQFDQIYNDNDKFLVLQNDKWGWCDGEGKITINPQFTEALPFADNELAPVESGKTWGYVDKEGKIVINPQFDKAYPFNGDLALVRSASQYGFIDKEGKFKINPQFSSISIDLEYCISIGRSIYQQVETDFFDVNALANRIDPSKPEGFDFKTPLSQIMTKLNLTSERISEYGDEHLVISNEKIGRELVLNFYIVGRFYNQVPDGWYTRNVLDNTLSPSSYAYKIELSGKAREKANEIMDAVGSKLTGFTKSIEETGLKINVYTKDYTEVRMWNEGGYIIIFINNAELLENQYYD